MTRIFQRIAPLVIITLLTGACAASMVSGSGDYRPERDERGATQAATDTAITSTIKGKYAADPVISVFDIGVRTWNGTVTLTGTVGSFKARDEAEAVARATRGVTAVNNLIDIEDRSEAQ